MNGVATTLLTLRSPAVRWYKNSFKILRQALPPIMSTLCLPDVTACNQNLQVAPPLPDLHTASEQILSLDAHIHVLIFLCTLPPLPPTHTHARTHTHTHTRMHAHMHTHTHNTRTHTHTRTHIPSVISYLLHSTNTYLSSFPPHFLLHTHTPFLISFCPPSFTHPTHTHMYTHTHTHTILP